MVWFLTVHDMMNTFFRFGDFFLVFFVLRCQVVMLGLDAAGKTTILYKLHIGEVLSTVPTIGRSDCSSIFIFFAFSHLSYNGFTEDFKFLTQVSMLRKFSTRMSSSQFGMLVAKRS